MKKKLTFGRVYEKVGNLFILGLMILVFSMLSPAFLRTQNLMNILRQVSMMAIVSVGFTILVISGGLDLSVGSMIAVMNVISGLLLKAGIAPFWAISAGILAATVIGTFNGFVIVKARIPAMMGTIAMLTLLRGLAFILTRGYPIYDIPASIKYLGQGVVFGIVPVPVIIMLIVVIFGVILLGKTYLGRYFFAVGSNNEATRLCGIDVAKVQILAYTITGFLTGIAGMIMLGRVSSAQPGGADGFELDVLTAVVLGGVSVNGGRGSVPLAMVGVIVIGVLSNGMSLLGLNEYWQKLVKGLVLLVVISVDSIRIQRSLNSTK